MNIMMKIFKEKIKEKYDKIEIKIYLEDISNNTFMIYYVMPPICLDIDDIELLEDIENFNLNKNIHQYYLIFNEFSCDKEEFYEQLKLLKTIAIDSLSKI